MRLWSFILVTVISATLAGAQNASAVEAASGEAAAGETNAGSDGTSVDALAASARRAGLRVLEAAHLVLATDRPVRAGDGVDDLPRIFDEAWAAWCEHFAIDPAAHREWRAFGCLVVDRDRFRAAGLLPDTIPDFVNGFCSRHRFWMADQSNAAYRRHLLLHEGVHAFTLTLRSLDTPPWYTEGIAECLATHRLDAEGGFEPTPLPLRAADVEQLGRIETIRSLRRTVACPGLDAVLETPGTNHRDLSAYAASWAAVALLSKHPRHATTFSAAERGPLDAAFNRRLMESDGWDGRLAAKDFDAFTDEIDYGFDFSRSAIDWAPGRPLDSRQTIPVTAGRGWQNSGWSLRAGACYSIVASGRCTIGFLEGDAPAEPVRIETEADGISLRWYRGSPLGRLLVAQWVEQPADGGRPRFVTLHTGAKGSCTAAVDGPVFLKLNEPPGELADDDGRLDVTIEPKP